MRLKHVVLTMLMAGVFVSSCKKDDDVAPIPTGDYINGILVSNEGPFNTGTGTVNFISNDFETVEDAIYNQVNGQDLGNIVQSIGFDNNNSYIIANVSNKITVVDRNTFVKKAEITEGLTNPRYFVSLDELIYVAHQGGFGQHNAISVIDPGTNEVTTILTVGDVPNSMQVDMEGNLWVLCGGKPSYADQETGGSLLKINRTTNEVISSFDFAATEHPNHLSRNGNDFYYTLNGDVFKFNDSDTSLPTTSELSGLNIYAMTALDNMLYVTDAKDFASNGSLSIYDLRTNLEEKVFEVGISRFIMYLFSLLKFDTHGRIYNGSIFYRR